MGVDEGNLQVIDVDVILENCPITIVIRNLLVYSTIQYSTKVIILYDAVVPVLNVRRNPNFVCCIPPVPRWLLLEGSLYEYERGRIPAVFF